jgi:hypothetical protein
VTLRLWNGESAKCRPCIINETYSCPKNLRQDPSLRETCLPSLLSPQTKLSFFAYLLSTSDLSEVGSLGLSDLQMVLRFPYFVSTGDLSEIGSLGVVSPQETLLRFACLLSTGDLAEVDMLARLMNGMFMSLMHRILACQTVVVSMRHDVQLGKGVVIEYVVIAHVGVVRRSVPVVWAGRRVFRVRRVVLSRTTKEEHDDGVRGVGGEVGEVLEDG